jgi:tetratricopeptide (TPR) repeat protein
MRRRSEQRIHETVRLVNEAEALVQAEQPRAALEQAAEAVSVSTGLPPEIRAAGLHVRARAHDALGELDAAEADLAAALELDPAVPERWMFMAQLATSRADWSAASERFATAIEVAESVDAPTVVAQAHWELANLAWVVGDVERARGEFAAAIETAEQLGDVKAAAFAELGLAELETAEGERERAHERYAHVRTLAELLPELEARVTAEPAAATTDWAGVPEELPRPFGEPVLRVILMPSLGENARLELWPGDGDEPLHSVVPFRFTVHPRTHERIRWYAEEYAARPLDPAPAIAADVERELERLGEALYRSLFNHSEAAQIAGRLSGLADVLRVEIVADVPAADVLPWELLRDPTQGVEFALAGRSITRTTSRADGARAAPPTRSDGAVRILLVIARPEGRLDVGFRSVSGPLVHELTASGAPVEVDVLRPPTFERLQEVLHDSGPYDLVHFDGHGTFDAATESSVLVFESSDEAGAFVGGDALGAELSAAGARLLVMNACRSAAGYDEQAYGSVAREALKRGLAAVVAMRFNVYVPTAALFVGGLYRALGEGRALEDAVAEARRLLTERTDRGGLPVVRDWFVPVLYQAAPVHLAGAVAATTRAAREVGLPPPPRHGFVGRDEVFVELESALVSNPHVVLRAFAGAGKTTLATEFARWYSRTGGCGVAGPLVDLAGAPPVEDVRRSIGPYEARALVLWDNARELSPEHIRLLDDIAARGGRVLLVRDRPSDSPGLPVVPMPNLPAEEGYALAQAVAAETSMTLAPEVVVAIVRSLRGHALGIELAARELARRGATAEQDVERLLEEVVNPVNGRPAPWTLPLCAGLEDGVDSPDVSLVAQFRGYVSAVGLGTLRGDDDFDAAVATLEAMEERGILTRVSFGIYAIHPGLAVALAAAGRFEPPGIAFAEAMAQTASAWSALAETQGADVPWPVEVANVVAARRLASRERQWPLVLQLLDSVSALHLHAGMTDLRLTETREAAQDLVDPDTGEPLPGMEAYADALLGHLAWVAEAEGDDARALRLRTADVERRREAAAGALSVPPERRTDEDRSLVRRLAVGLTNLAPVQRELRDPRALDSMAEAVALARGLGDWRLEVQNRLNSGVYWMTVPAPPEFERADAEFRVGYDLAAENDPALAGMLMTERGTVHYERGLVTADLDAARDEFELAADLLELATSLRDPDPVLCHQLGQVHRQLGNLAESRAWFEETIALRESELEPGAGGDARLHLALALEDAGLLDEALRFARSAEQVLAQAHEPDAELQMELDQVLARLSLFTRA